MLTADDEKWLIREVFADGAHVARYGTKNNKFQAVADVVNGRNCAPEKMAWKNAQDRYELLQ